MTFAGSIRFGPWSRRRRQQRRFQQGSIDPFLPPPPDLLTHTQIAGNKKEPLTKPSTRFDAAKVITGAAGRARSPCTDANGPIQPRPHPSAAELPVVEVNHLCLRIKQARLLREAA